MDYSGSMTWLRHRLELSRAGAGMNVRAMEGMRGLAVALVFLTHYCSQSAAWTDGTARMRDIAHVLHALGNTGVDLFFVLSGYLIYRTLVVREQAFGHFMARRIERLYPAFLVVFAIYCLLSFMLPQYSRIPAEAPLSYLLANLLLLPGVFPIEPMITVAWSLSYEMFFYLCLPLLVWAFNLRRRQAHQRVAGVAFAAIALAACSAMADGVYVRMLMFLAGMLLHEAIASRAVRAPGSTLAALALAFGLFASAVDGFGFLKTGILFAAFLLLCLNCFLRPQDWLPKAFSWTPLRWLGNMSYSYYLLHGLVLKVVFLVLDRFPLLEQHGGLAFFLMLPLCFAATVLGSAMLFLVVERPLSLQPAARRVLGAQAG